MAGYKAAGTPYIKPTFIPNAPYKTLGNSAKFEIAIDESVLDIKNYQGGGGLEESFREVNKATINIEAKDLKAENIALAVLGSLSQVTSKTITDQEHAIEPGAYIDLDGIGQKNIVIKNNVSGDPLLEGIDYEIKRGGVVISDNPVTELQTPALISYATSDSQKVEAILRAGAEFSIIFDGINEITQKGFKANIFRVKLGASLIPFINGDDTGTLTISGDILRDSSKSGVGISKFYKVDYEK